MRILIVDDDKIDRLAITRAIRNTDIQTSITEAETVDEGLSLLKGRCYEVLILDFSMPRKNGIEMLIELNKLSEDTNTAVIMMTGYEDDRLVLECFDAGAHEFLLKADVNPRTLRRALLNTRTRFSLQKQKTKTYGNSISVSERDWQTGLANRNQFDKSIHNQFSEASDSLGKMGLLLIHLDNYTDQSKEHQNALISKVVERMQSCLFEKEFFARLGEETFAISTLGHDSAQHTNLLATRLLNIFSSPFRSGGERLSLTASIGVSIYLNEGETLDDFLKSAQSALDDARKEDGNRAIFSKGNHPSPSRALEEAGNVLGLDTEFNI